MTEDIPPNSIEAEQAVLGCILLDQGVLSKVADGVKSAMFYDLRHRTIYDEIMAMSSENIGIDVVTISQRLKDKNSLESVGGLAYMSSLADCVTGPSNVSYYIGILSEKWRLRRIVESCSAAIISARSRTPDPDEIASEIIESLSDRETVSSVVTAKQSTLEVVDEIQREASGEKGKTYSTGWTKMDNIVRTFGPGSMMVVGARPSVGKTSLMTSMCLRYASAGVKVGVMSLEVPHAAWTRKMIFNSSMVNDQPWGFLNDGERRAVFVGATRVSSIPMIIDDRSCSSSELPIRARGLIAAGCNILMVDYLQYVSVDGDITEGVARVSVALKGIAKDHGVGVIVASQLNREVEKEKRKPRLSDLRSSGSIEQDADIVLLLHTDPSLFNEASRPVTVDVAKQRNGPTGPLDFLFMKGQSRFEEVTTRIEEDAK